MSKIKAIHPNWLVPQHVQAFTTTRQGGVSKSPYKSFNLASHVDDDINDVIINRSKLNQILPAEAKWLTQTHTNRIAELHHDTVLKGEFDACYTTESHVVCTVLTADCLPVLLTDVRGRFVAAIHGGWRGLAKCVLANSVATIRLRHPQIQAKEFVAWLGPAIGAKHFEVGEEVKVALLNTLYSEPDDVDKLFKPSENKHKYYCDIYQLARIQLAQLGIVQVYGGEYCTFAESKRFFSYRRDGKTGRMASCIWLV